MRIALTLLLTLASFLFTPAALAQYVPDQDIEIERTGPTTFKITGKNSWGKVDVKIADQHLFRGFKAEGKAGDKKVNLDIKSAGLGAGWRIEGKIGTDIKVDVRVRQDGAFSKTWTVKGKAGDRNIDEEITGEWDIDPAAAGVFVVFDCCEGVPPPPDSGDDEDDSED